MNNLLIHEAVEAALMNEPERKMDRQLWVSDLGKNPYHAFKRLLTGKMDTFDLPTRLKMDGGNALEAVTLRQVAENISRPIRTQFPLFNDIWTGYADLVIGHGSPDVIIYDHKGAAGKWWDYKWSLPRESDCCQVWMYGQLYKEMYGIEPQLGLYYRGWGTWAEFRLSFKLIAKRGNVYAIEADGYVTSDKGDPLPQTRYRMVNPAWLRAELESGFGLIESGKLTIDDVQKMEPSGPDWDYATDSYERLEAIYGSPEE